MQTIAITATATATTKLDEENDNNIHFMGITKDQEEALTENLVQFSTCGAELLQKYWAGNQGASVVWSMFELVDELSALLGQNKRSHLIQKLEFYSCLLNYTALEQNCWEQS